MKLQNQSGDVHLFKSIGEITKDDVGEECTLDCMRGFHFDMSVKQMSDALNTVEQHNQGYF